MQVNGKSKFQSLKLLLFFALVLFVAYLPATSFMFFLKNDAFTGYFPPKFFISESLKAGHLPLWNPYINFGLPQYGDMSSGFWSPVTWLIAATAGYNAYTFTIEVFLYLFIAGIGMYKFCKSLDLNAAVCVIAGVSFMCSGYMVGHLQHFNWLSGAAFLPFCFLYYRRLLLKFKWDTLLACAFSFYMLISSAHPGITIGAIYLFVAYALCELVRVYRQKQGTVAQFLKVNLYLFVVILLLCAGIISGYLDILPNITRGQKVILTEALTAPTSYASWISAIIPLATVTNDTLFNTDISMRNIYFGLILLLFFFYGLASQKNAMQKFFLFCGLFFLLLSSGGIFKTFAYNFLPLTGYVRLAGEFAVFALLCFIPFAAISLNRFFNSSQIFSAKLKMIYFSLVSLFAISIGYGAVIIIDDWSGLHSLINFISAQPGLINKIKNLIDHIGFADILFIQGSLQLLVLLAIGYCLAKKKKKLLMGIFMIDIIMATLLNVPFTGVGKTSVAQLQHLIDKSPEKIPVPKLKPINTYDSMPLEYTSMIGSWSFYNKQPGTAMQIPYPIILNNTRSIFLNHEEVFLKPFLFTENKSIIQVKKYTGSTLLANVTSMQPGTLVFQQNFYSHWYYYDKAGKHRANKYKNIFLSAKVEQGNQDIRFKFEPTLIKFMMFLSASLLIVLILIYFFLRFYGEKNPILLNDEKHLQ